MSTHDRRTIECDEQPAGGGNGAWTGPHAEYDKYGEPTGARFYRCRGCGREALEEIGRERVGHRDDCPHGGN